MLLWGIRGQRLSRPAIPSETSGLRFSVGFHAREALVASGLGRPQPGGWSPDRAPQRGDCWWRVPPASAAPEPGAGGTGGGLRAAGCGSRRGTQKAEGRAEGGRGEEALLPSRPTPRQVGAGTRRPGKQARGEGAAPRRREGPCRLPESLEDATARS